MFDNWPIEILIGKQTKPKKKQIISLLEQNKQMSQSKTDVLNDLEKKENGKKMWSNPKGKKKKVNTVNRGIQIAGVHEVLANDQWRTPNYLLEKEGGRFRKKVFRFISPKKSYTERWC